MEAPIPTHLRQAYARCARAASSHYENFPVASLLLERDIRPHVAALYAFARTADDFADEPRFEGSRLKKLAAWERALRAALQGRPAPLELQAFAYTMKAFQIPTSLPLDLLRAFRMDAVGHRYKSWGSLLYYCRHSADPVGRMVLLLHGIRDKKLHVYSDFICTGLQLINFWQDTSQDLKRGRVYYPSDEMKRTGVREKDFLQGLDSPAIRAMVHNVTDDTEAHFRKGLPLLGSVTGRLRLELRATYLGGLGILSKIRGTDYNVLRQRPRLGRAEKLFIALGTLFGSDLKGKP